MLAVKEGCSTKAGAAVCGGGAEAGGSMAPQAGATGGGGGAGFHAVASDLFTQNFSVAAIGPFDAGHTFAAVG